MPLFSRQSAIETILAVTKPNNCRKLAGNLLRMAQSVPVTGSIRSAAGSSSPVYHFRRSCLTSCL